MGAWMPSCRSVAEKLLIGELSEASWGLRMMIRLHLLMCRHCGRLAWQLRLIHDALRLKWRYNPPPTEANDLRRRILEHLK